MSDNPAQNFDQSSQIVDRLAAIERKIDMLLSIVRNLVPPKPIIPGEKP